MTRKTKRNETSLRFDLNDAQIKALRGGQAASPKTRLVKGQKRNTSYIACNAAFIACNAAFNTD